MTNIFIYRYQFNPIYTKKPIINLIVLISMTQMPSSDFLLCKALIDYNLVFILNN